MRVERHAMRLAVPGEAISVQEILDLDRGVVLQPELPERNLEREFMRVVGVEIDVEQEVARRFRVALAVVEDVVVEGVVEGQRFIGADGRVLAAQAIDQRDVRLDVAGRVHVPDADLVLLGIEILFLARNGPRLADLVSV